VKPLSVYSIIPPKHTASFYYRLQVPLETAAELGLPVESHIDVNDASIKTEERVKTFCESDVILLYQPIGEQPINNIKGIQGFIPTKQGDSWKYPPTVIIESDDNLFNVSPLNQAFKSLGHRDMAGKEIPLGHNIGVERGGEKKILWADGVNDFSLLGNRQRIQSFKTLLEMADAVCCSTPYVEQAIKRECSPRRTRVFPNLVRFDHYEQVDLVKDPNQIKIMWQGGIAHYEDWYPLRQALGNITRKYPEVHWVIWGAQYPWVNELIPPHRMTYVSWYPYHEYKLRLAMIGHDISLAPLSSNVFNDCRSAIKWYEASVLKNDIATLAQNTGPYKDEIIDGETALLFSNPEEFESQLSRLIEDTKLRKQLGRNAKDWVHEHRDAMKEVPKIVSFWEQLREEKKREQPCPSDEHWVEIEKEAAAEEELAGV
jgi:glycosyltransferase involved in cell wall biosynthesis